jgi:hypothetical protein
MAIFWRVLGVSPVEGLALALGLVVLAVVFALVRARRAQGSPRGLSL